MRPGAGAGASSGAGRRRVRPPVKAQPVRIDAAMAPERAVRAIAAAAFRHLRANEAGAMAGGDAEHVHQMRVALRRLRCVLRLFPGTSAAQVRAAHDGELKSLGAVLGEVRDLDVLSDLLRLPFPGNAAIDPVVLEAALARLSAAARQRMRAHLVSAGYARLVAGIGAWLRAGAAESGGVDLATLARQRLRHLHKRVLRGVGRYRTMDDGTRHRFRIDVKRARYGTEFFGPLYPAAQVAPYLAALSGAQDSLGCLTDINMVRRLLRDVDVGPASRTALLRRCESGAGPADAGLSHEFRRIERAGGFWKCQH
jgi:triphosphatase